MRDETPVFSRAATAAPHRAASLAGKTILSEGGNAIEAMLAMASTIAVVYPHMNAIGGDGFWLIREPGGRTHYIEACGFAGAKATIAHYHELGHHEIPKRGALAALTVPGAIAGWILAHEMARSMGGKIPLPDLLREALRSAREGYAQSFSEHAAAPREFAALAAVPGFAAQYLMDGKFPAEGTMRSSPALGETFEHLSRAGLDDFYRGDVAREMAADLERAESPVTRADLNAMHAKLRPPLSLKLKGRTLYNSQPPTQGLAALYMLGLFERLGVTRAESFAHIHALIETAKRALVLRDQVCTDFDALKQPAENYLTSAFLDREAARISMTRAAQWPLPPDAGDTIWMGAIDASGLSVSYIQSVFWEYGSGLRLPATGVLMQNRGTSFSLDAKALNPLTPGRRPFHTLTPPLCAYDDGRVLSYGSMGGDGQPQFQAQIFTRMELGMGPLEAVSAPRFLFGKTWGADSTSLKLEEGFDDALVSALRKAGNEIEMRPGARSQSFGHAGALMRRRDGSIAAAHDPRSDGSAEGF